MADMATSAIFIASDNLVVIEEVFDRLGLLTVAELLAGTGTMTLYSDESHSTPVAGAQDLTITVFPGQTESPASFYASIPASATAALVEGAQYWAVSTLRCLDVSTGDYVTLTLEEVCEAKWKT